MDMLRLRAPPGLKDQVVGLWALRGRTAGPYSGLPKPFVEMIVSLSGVHRWRAAPHTPVHLFDSGWITPMQTGPRFAETEGPLHLLGARLTLPAATALFGPLGRLGSPAPIPLEAALGAEAEALRERLCLAGSDRQALALLADWLLDRLSGLSPLALPCPRQLAVLGWRAEGLSDLLGLSPRGLRKRFHECFGIAPKLWLQLSRFDAVLASRPQPGSLADTAAAFGYADQAHMTLEFGRFAGISPGRYAAVRARTAAPALAPHFVPGR